MTVKAFFPLVSLLCLHGPLAAQTAGQFEVYRDARTVHVGDEYIANWAPLSGACISVAVPVLKAADRVIVTYRPYGLERAFLRIGDIQSVLPAQQPMPGRRNPNYWGRLETVSLVMNRSLFNESLWICAENVAPYNARIDLDDFMLDYLQVVVAPAAPPPAAPLPAQSVATTAPAKPAAPRLDQASVAALQAELEKQTLRSVVLKELVAQQSKATSGMGVVSREIFRKMVAELEQEISDIQKTAQSRYSTSIKPNNASLDLSARDKSRSFPPVPYYVAGQVGNGEFWLEPLVKDSGELVYRLNFIDPSERNERVTSQFELTLDELAETRAALVKVYEWSQTAKENKVRMRYEKAAACFPATMCAARVTGNTSTEIVFLIYEDGATGAQLVRNKGAFAERYTMSMDSAAMLTAYLDYVDAAAKQEFDAGSMTRERLDTMFK